MNFFLLNVWWIQKYIYLRSNRFRHASHRPAYQGGTFTLYTMSEYTNRALSIEEQIVRLKENGLIIDDEKVAHKFLSIISYFRLASYWRPMEKLPHQFKPNSRFDNALSLYYFDKELRALIFSAIQSIEIALRTKVIHSFSMIPQLPKQMTEHWIDNMDLDTHKLYVQLCCVVYWLNSIYEDNDFVEKFKVLLLKYPNVDITAMGFPKNWEEEPLWRS